MKYTIRPAIRRVKKMLITIRPAIRRVKKMLITDQMMNREST